jgi:hypothetical protein
MNSSHPCMVRKRQSNVVVRACLVLYSHLYCFQDCKEAALYTSPKFGHVCAAHYNASPSMVKKTFSTFEVIIHCSNEAHDSATIATSYCSTCNYLSCKSCYKKHPSPDHKLHKLEDLPANFAEQRLTSYMNDMKLDKDDIAQKIQKIKQAMNETSKV